MNKFKIGDRVVRAHNKLGDNAWQTACHAANSPVDRAYVVTGYTDGGVWLQLDGLPTERCLWDDNNFDLVATATAAGALEEGLAMCCGTVADKPLLLKQLADLKQELALHKDFVQYTETRTRASIAERDALADQLAQVSDQRDAAVAAAKGFGEDILAMKRDARHGRYEAQIGAMAAVRILRALASGVEDLDLYDLANQLGHISRICDEQGNGADAKLCGEAASALGIAARAVTDWQAI